MYIHQPIKQVLLPQKLLAVSFPSVSFLNSQSTLELGLATVSQEFQNLLPSQR